ncbi:MAG: hypothetical protein AAGD11_02585 [Planctomycetota bacterium]
MNESPLRKFCESRHRKLIVAIVTTLFGLLVLIPLVDDYFDKKRSHNTLTDDLDRARQTDDGLSANEQQVAEIVAKLEAIESRTVSTESVSAYRSKIVELVRASGCQVRRFDVSSPTLRPWLANDNPLESMLPPDAKKRKTPFALERRNVVLLVDGSMESMRELLGKLHDDDALAYLHRLGLQAASRGGDQVTMELEMWLFALGRQKV